MTGNKYVITITRQFGSMGRPIAKKMAEILGIEYYDRDIVDKAAEKLNLPVSVIDEREEKASSRVANPFSRMVFPLGTQNTTEQQDKIFEAQKNIIEFLAEKESCIIVGRCADYVLSEYENSMHIYIYAPYKQRLKHCIEDLGLSEEEGKRMIFSVDEARTSYHKNYAGYLPDDSKYKDIMINSSFLGIDKTAEYLVSLAKERFQI